MAYMGIEIQITSFINFDGYKTWGFRCPSINQRQLPCWPTKKEAVESAHFHINLWARGQ